MNLGFLGTGTITSAMITGLHAAGARYSLRVSPRNAQTAAKLAASYPEVSVAASNQDVLDHSEAIVIAVRPQVTEATLAELRFRADHKIISVVSGFSLHKISTLVSPAGGVTRAVPLPSTAKLRSPTAICPRDSATVELFGLLGEAFEVDNEDEFDALCTATATMAAYFAFADGVATWLTRHGISSEQARGYVASLQSGLAHTAVEMPERSYHALGDDHATSGGTNEQLLKHLVDHHVFDVLSDALDGIMRRVSAGRLAESAH